ncbi:MAG: hypothetical protein U9O94_09180, partial [Nanoarchaeota archaeon]|nr:hypothetical protein [Nanoarchaeota archaeon]
HTSVSETTVSGKIINFVLPLKQFTNRQTITTGLINSVSYDIVKEIYNIINDDIVIVSFNDGSWVEAKFDLLKNPLEVSPVFEGSDQYYITIRVII